MLAVEGDLTLVNVAITGGRSITSAIPATGTYPQPWTLARGAAVAVWGVARLVDCSLYDNRAQGDFEQSRDRGAFGGAVYADIVEMDNCVVAGNDVLGGGAAGGGVYSVGGADNAGTLRRDPTGTGAERHRGDRAALIAKAGARVRSGRCHSASVE